MDSTHGSGLDQATEDLISRLYLQDALQIEDAVDYFESGKGKSRELTDEELAFQLQNGELKDESRRYSDNRMAMSLATAVHTDGQILTDILLDEERAASGRAIKTPQAEFSAAAALRKQKPVGLRSCVACDDCMKPDNTLHAPCGHEYCRSCIEGLYNASLTDETLFPPRCCGQHIDIRIARTFLKSDLLERYEKKRIELETPNKTYCHFLKCSAFINTSCLKGQVATCPECNRKTCTSCKSQAHTGDCLDDPATQQLFATAKVNGWQRCYSCQRLVELDHGCNHMVLVRLICPLSY
ncbi:hypothetical protein BDV25DRAFT_140314 [Aspergillus avenaceus]|uniref:RBR-type E3 ubiquitin transferase n=1 Tax=Aspergillus avenaceus TaxID=36643 RepID=A0A5N6TV20_ASPAV|nr:hypothetical protein BDV25DRAFT_140314 [Aspergillus avenaceus]